VTARGAGGAGPFGEVRAGPKRFSGLLASRRLFGLEVVELVVYAISVTGVLANAVIAPALPNIAHDLHVSVGGVSLIVALASLPGIAMAPIIGVAADRFGRREVVVPCLVVFGIGGLLGAAAPTFRILCLARLLQGFGGAGLVNLAVVILGDRYDGVERARAIGRNAAVLTSSIAVLPLIGGVLTHFGGWRLAFVPFGLALVMAVVVNRVVPAATLFDSTTTLRAQLSDAGTYVRDRRVIGMCVAGFASFVLVFGLVLTALPVHLKDAFDAGPVVRGIVLGLPAIGNVTTSLLVGRLSTRHGTWPLVIAGFVVMCVAFAGIAAAPALLLAVGCVLGYGFGEGLTIVPLQSYAAGLAPAEHRGKIVSLWVSAARAGQFTGPVVVGPLIDAHGSRFPFAVGAVAAAAAAITLLGVRRVMTVPARAAPGG